MSKLTANTAQLGDIWLYAGAGDLFSDLIEREQKKRGYGEFSRFVHAEISLGGYETVYTQPPISTMEDIRIIHPGREAVLLRLAYPDYAKNTGKMVEGIYDILHTAYDWLGVVKFKIDILPEDPLAYFCSKGVAYVIQQFYPHYPSGLQFGNVPPAALVADRRGKQLLEIVEVWCGIITNIEEA